MKKPYMAAKRTIPTAFFTAKRQNSRSVQHVLHISTAFIGPYLFTARLVTIRPMALTALRIVSYLGVSKLSANGLGKVRTE
jgi:hypothetical protein